MKTPSPTSVTESFISWDLVYLNLRSLPWEHPVSFRGLHEYLMAQHNLLPVGGLDLLTDFWGKSLSSSRAVCTAESKVAPQASLWLLSSDQTFMKNTCSCSSCTTWSRAQVTALVWLMIELKIFPKLHNRLTIFLILSYYFGIELFTNTWPL